jgi:hypothetical protein
MVFLLLCKYNTIDKSDEMSVVYFCQQQQQQQAEKAACCHNTGFHTSRPCYLEKSKMLFFPFSLCLLFLFFFKFHDNQLHYFDQSCMRTRQDAGISFRQQQLLEVAGENKTPFPRQRRKKLKKNRNRNQCETTTTTNKWDTYRKTINRLLLTLIRDEHFCTTLSVQRSRDSIILLGELQHYGEKIRNCKLAILKQFESLEAENGDHTRHAALAVADSNGMVDLESINCSKCDGVDTEGDDILFCDRDGCFRAYHQSCLSPPLRTDPDNADFDDPDQDWFCWQCECLDDCLEMANDMCNTDVTSVEQLFPEVRQTDDTGEYANEEEEEEEEESDEEDEDYNSQCGEDSHDDDDDDVGEEEEEEEEEGSSVEDVCKGVDPDSDTDDNEVESDDDEVLSIDDDEVNIEPLTFSIFLFL